MAFKLFKKEVRFGIPDAIDYLPDRNQNDVPDICEDYDKVDNSGFNDVDGNGTPDMLDLEDKNKDGIPDAFEHLADRDGNGIPDSIDAIGK